MYICINIGHVDAHICIYICNTHTQTHTYACIQADVLGAVKASTKLQGRELDVFVQSILTNIHGRPTTYSFLVFMSSGAEHFDQYTW